MPGPEPRVKIEAGKRFGQLVVIRATRNQHVSGKQYESFFLCCCDCGNEKEIRARHLRNGAVISCGCRKKAVFLTHGMSRTSVYKIWTGMKQRCQNPHFKQYQDYGGRGIKVCKRWSTFDKFLKDIGPRPSLEHSLERIDNNGDYSPQNCRWATKSEQAANSRKNVALTAFGRTQHLNAWAREYHINLGTLRYRLRIGLSIEQALTIAPALKRGHLQNVLNS